MSAVGAGPTASAPGGLALGSTQELDDEGTAATDVVLVDDAASLRTLYRSVLERDGRFDVVGEAADGRSGIDQAGAHQPDLLLLDLSMPDMDGLEALPKIREVAPDTTVIVLSGFLEDRFGDQALDLGAAGYIEKGGSPADVVETIVEIAGDELEIPPAHRHPPPDRLREPLRDVERQVDRIAERWSPDLDGEIDEPLRKALNGTRRMEAILGGLLTYGRLGKDDDPRPVALDDALDRAIDALQDPIDTADAEIRRGDLPVVHGRPSEIVRLLEETIDNAITFHDGSPTVRVTADPDGDRWRIVVADDGPGIPDDRRDQVLDLFWTSADDADHHGLGLALCRRIVERHDGQLDIEDAETGGTKVTFTLHRAETEAS